MDGRVWELHEKGRARVDSQNTCDLEIPLADIIRKLGTSVACACDMIPEINLKFATHKVQPHQIPLNTFIPSQNSFVP